MDYSASYELIVSQVASFSAAAFVILAAIIGVGIGLLVFRWGWKKTVEVSGSGPSYMSSYEGMNFAAVSRVARRKIRESYYRNTEGI